MNPLFLSRVPRLKPCLLLGMILLINPGFWSAPALGMDCPPPGRLLSPGAPPPVAAFDPNPSPEDVSLPLPCGGRLILRHVVVPSQGYLGDLRPELGCRDCARPDLGFMESRRREALSGAFVLDDLPRTWKEKLTRLARLGDGRAPKPGSKGKIGLYYFIGKYEITEYQWKAVMGGPCPEVEAELTRDDPRPKTDISWFEAVEFTRRYTEWLLKNAPDTLPKFPGGRPAFLRLPTEAEWEYAARGGHRVTETELDQEEFFPRGGRPYSEFAVFTEPGAAKVPERLAWIGSKCSNPLILFDTAGNASEMVLDPFRFALGDRLHGARGGFVVKGGSFLKGKAEILPGRREEAPFYLDQGAYRSGDLGFRVVLSAIVTPRTRLEALRREWVRTSSKPAPEPVPEAEKTSGQDALAELERLLDQTGEGPVKKRLTRIKELLLGSSGQPPSPAERIQGGVYSALLASESVLTYAVRRKTVKDWLRRVEGLPRESFVPSDLQWLEERIAKEKANVAGLEANISRLTVYYLGRIEELQRFPEDLVGLQLERIAAELNPGQEVGPILAVRLEIFQKHLEEWRAGDRWLNEEAVQVDLIPESLR